MAEWVLLLRSLMLYQRGVGGIFIVLRLKNATNRKTTASVVEKAADAVSVWVDERVAKLARRDRGFGDQVTEYLSLQEAYKCTSRAIDIPLGDCGGEGYVSMLATGHVISRWFDVEETELAAILAPLGFVPQVDRINDWGGVFAIAKKQIVHLTNEWDGDDDEIGVEIDGDPYTFPMSKLPQRDRRRLEAAWKAQACLCPVCVPRARSTNQRATRPARTRGGASKRANS
jgi:hypothetical protein